MRTGIFLDDPVFELYKIKKKITKKPDNLEQRPCLLLHFFCVCYFGISNKIHLKDMIDSSVFYLVTNFEVASTKGVC